MRFSASGRLLFLIIFQALLAPLQGCASFYLHDAATQKQTDSAKSALDTLKPDAIFVAEASYLDGLESTETAVVTQDYAASRDRDVLLALNGTGPGGLDGLTTLKGRIDGYLLSLLGATDTQCDRKFWRAIDIDPTMIWGQTATLQPFMQQTLQHEIDRINSSCRRSAFPPLLPESPSTSLLAAEQAVIVDLTNIERLQKCAKAAQQTLDTSLTDIKTKLSADKPSASDLNDDLKRLQSALSDANPLIRKYASVKLSAEVGATIDALSPAGSTPQSGLTTEERSGIAVMQSIFKVGDAFASPPREPHPNALAAAQSWLDYIGSQASTELQNTQMQLKDHQAQFAAVLTEIYYLSKAGEEAQKIKPPVKALLGTQGLADLINAKDEANTRAIDGALLYYAAAWTRGFALDAIASRIGYLDQRRAKLATGRTAAAAWVGSLKPAVETLASYGSGGFDPQIVARLIQALSLTGVAVGVNK
jgi:hypothetical protein